MTTAEHPDTRTLVAVTWPSGEMPSEEQARKRWIARHLMTLARRPVDEAHLLDQVQDIPLTYGSFVVREGESLIVPKFTGLWSLVDCVIFGTRTNHHTLEQLVWTGPALWVKRYSERHRKADRLKVLHLFDAHDEPLIWLRLVPPKLSLEE